MYTLTWHDSQGICALAGDSPSISAVYTAIKGSPGFAEAQVRHAVSGNRLDPEKGFRAIRETGER